MYRSHITYCIAFLLVHSAFGFVAEDDSSSAPASEKSYHLKEITITASKLPLTAASSASPATVITLREIQQSNAQSLAQLLSSVSGLFVKDYGAGGGLKTLAQRGLGPEHTLVLLNGMRISGMQNSLVDLGLFGADEASSVEILHGGHSSSFGADAVAGVVNVVTQPPDRENIRVLSGFGSFGYRLLHVTGGVSASRAGIRGTYREEQGDDDFPFIFRNGNQLYHLRRSNSDFFSRTGSLQSILTLDDETQLSIVGRTFDSKRGVAGFVVGPASTSIARQFDTDHLVQTVVSGVLLPQLRYKAGLQFHQTYQRYVDAAFFVGQSSIDNHFRNDDWRLDASADYVAGINTRLALGAELNTATARGNSLNADVRRSAFGTYIHLEQVVVREADVVESITLFPSLRFDHLRTESNLISRFSPRLGFTAQLREIGDVAPMIRASVSRNFRVPTFNELYYAGGGGIGNPDLRPEISTGIDAGVGVKFRLAGTHLIQATYFDVDMQDRIVWVAAGGASVTPKNIRSVRSNGIELQHKYTLAQGWLEAVTNYAFTSARKTSPDFPGDPNVNTRLIYVPEEAASFALNLSHSSDTALLSEIGGSVLVQYTGFRYTNEDNSRFLTSFTVVNANVRSKFAVAGGSLLVRCDVNNLFNKEYQSIIAYPMPGRSFRLMLGVSY